MRKNLNKLATLALSGMMVMSMAMPAMAATYTKKNGWTKTLYTDLYTPAPNTTFKFKISQLTDEEKANEKKVTLGQEQFDAILDGDPSAVTFGDAEFTSALGLGTKINAKDGTPNGGRKHEKKVDITVDTSKLLKGHGYYLFKLEEEKGGYEGIYYTPIKYRVLVYYPNTTDINDMKVFVQKQTNGDWKNTACKTDNIYNNYGMHEPPVDPDPNPNPNPGPNPDPNPNYDTTHDVLINKVVKGTIDTALPEGGKFKLKITITPDHQPKDEKFSYRVGGKAADGEGYTLVDGKTTFPVEVEPGKPGVHIGGLTVGDEITVEETNGQKYTMTVEDNGSTYITRVAKKTGWNDYTFGFNSIKDDGVVTVVNTKNGATPTGIVMNVAPYAMMLAVAGGLGVVFVNRKKEEE